MTSKTDVDIAYCILYHGSEFLDELTESRLAYVFGPQTIKFARQGNIHILPIMGLRDDAYASPINNMLRNRNSSREYKELTKFLNRLPT